MFWFLLISMPHFLATSLSQILHLVNKRGNQDFNWTLLASNYMTSTLKTRDFHLHALSQNIIRVLPWKFL